MLRWQMPLSLLFLLAVLTLPLALQAAPTAPVAIPMACHIGAYVVQSDPKGVNLRAGPGQSYAVLKQLPKQSEPPLLTIRAGLGNWLRVSDVHGLNGQLLFGGPGWVYAPLLATSTRGTQDEYSPLYLHPDTRSPVQAKLKAATQVSILYCQGTWLKVRAGKSEGWLHADEQCPNPVRACH